MQPTHGYSGTPLLKKLGIKPEHKVYLVNAPENYSALLGQDISKQITKNSKDADVVHVFARESEALEKEFTNLIKAVSPVSVIWISWYKKASKITTDVNEDVIRAIVLPRGWVDVKVCAVSELWSGLKIVLRKNLR